MDEGKKAHLEIIENGLLGFCVGYYRGKFKLVILEKTIFRSQTWSNHWYPIINPIVDPIIGRIISPIMNPILQASSDSNGLVAKYA